MSYKLNGRNVYEGMYRRAENAKRNGNKAFFTELQSVVDLPEAAKNTYCHNCNGLGMMGLEIVVGGPYTDASNKTHVIWHEGNYYVRDLVLFDCPDCVGSGLFSRQAPREAELRL